MGRFPAAGRRYRARAVAITAAVALAGGLAATSAQAAVPVPAAAAARTPVVARPYAALVTLADGRQLMAGGCTPGHCPSITAEADLYDPATRTWTVTSPMLAPDAAAAAVLLRDGRVLVAAGCTTRLCGGITDTAQIFDPTTARWTYTGSLPWASSFLQAVPLADGRVLAAGGKGGDNRAALWNPATGRWSSTGAMRVERAEFTLTALPGGQVLAAGGSGGYFFDRVRASSETYDPSTGRWTLAGSMRHARKDHTARLQPSGRVLVQGGVDASYQPVTAAEWYDPATRSWTST